MNTNYLNNHIHDSYKAARREPMDLITEQRNKIEKKLVLVCRFGSDKDFLMSEIDVLMKLVKDKTIKEIDCAAVCRDISNDPIGTAKECFIHEP